MKKLDRVMRVVLVGLVLCASGAIAQHSNGQPFTEIRLGDVDGFGFGTGAGFVAANGGPVNPDGADVLKSLDFLPDISQTLGQEGMAVATTSGDDFDLRGSELSGNYLTGQGFTDLGSTGSEFTDISLSTSYDISSAANDVLVVAEPPTKGAGGFFPMPPASELPNQPGFVFDFFVSAADIAEGRDLFFNLVLGDYDVMPAQLMITRTDGTSFNAPVTYLGVDGLIQAAFVELAFTDVFSPGFLGTTCGFFGYLEVLFDAPSEPYTAFDFAELSTKPIATGGFPPTLNEKFPEPSSINEWTLVNPSLASFETGTLRIDNTTGSTLQLYSPWLAPARFDWDTYVNWVSRTDGDPAQPTVTLEVYDADFNLISTRSPFSTGTRGDHGVWGPERSAGFYADTEYWIDGVPYTSVYTRVVFHVAPGGTTWLDCVFVDDHERPLAVIITYLGGSVGELQILDGSGSWDMEDSTLQYEWTQLGGPAVTITNPDQEFAEFLRPPGPVTVTVGLVVTDTRGAESIQVVQNIAIE